MSDPRATAVFTSQLASYRELLEPHIAALCERLERDAKDNFGEFSYQTIHAYTSLLRRGGKRLRGSLVVVGYELCGGQDVSRVLPLASAIEMLHAYLLVLDDIYDYSETRRGGPTAHIMMRDLHKQQGWRGDSLHFGEAIAGLSAFVGVHTAMQELVSAPLDDSAKVKIVRLVNEALVMTGYGQVSDGFNEATQEASDDAVQRMLTWKTAYYSFINPLQVGAIAAGAQEGDLGCLHDYGIHAGLAFQVSDDILGTFGDEAKSGKSAKDDLREGKMTLLVSRALAKATPEQRTTLLEHLGNHNVTDAQYEECKEIIRVTGALDYAKALASEHSAQAVTALDDAPAEWNRQSLQFLRGFAQYVVRRKA